MLVPLPYTFAFFFLSAASQPCDLTAFIHPPSPLYRSCVSPPISLFAQNGGPTHGNEGTSSNNFPLRGGKNTLWEGGTRVVGAIAGPGIAGGGMTTYEKMHASDWLPTLVSLASGQDWTTFIPATEPKYDYGDGMDVQSMLTSVGGKSPRNWLLYEAHPTLTEVLA